jgi:hypothetical protein
MRRRIGCCPTKVSNTSVRLGEKYRDRRGDNNVLVDVLLDEEEVGHEGLDASADAPDELLLASEGGKTHQGRSEAYPDRVKLKRVQGAEAVPRGVTVQRRVMVEIRVLAADVYERMVTDHVLRGVSTEEAGLNRTW